MAYLVLARKWRPQVFEDLVGQPHIVRILKNALSQKRVSHSYLFSGPRGVGKTTTARILAKSLNCVEGPTPSPCGRCDFCMGITEGSSMDVIEIDGASNNSVDDIREIRERVRYAPSVLGKYKVYIIDEAHMLTESAFNALLKTIEEPPPHTIFVLATTAYRKIPATVMSRCQHLAFRRIPRDAIMERLRYICSIEGIKISDDALEMIARAADGSMRDSLTILDQVSSFAEEITANEVAQLLGMSDSALVSALAEAILEGDQHRILSLISEASEKGLDLRTLYRDLIVFLRDMLVLKTFERSGKELNRTFFELSQEEIDCMIRLSPKTSEEELTVMVNELIRSEHEIRNSTFPRIALEVNLIRLSLFKEFSSVRDVLNRLKEWRLPETDQFLEKKTGIELKDPTLSPEKVDGALKEERVSQDLLRFLDERDHVLASKLMHAEIEMNGDVLYIKFNGGHAFLADVLLGEEETLRKILGEYFGRPVRIKISASERSEGIRINDFKKEVLSRPEVREIIELFEGSVIDIRKNKD